MSVVCHSIRSRDIAGSPLCTMLNGELTEQLLINELKYTLKSHFIMCNIMHRYVGGVQVIKVIYSCVNVNI